MKVFVIDDTAITARLISEYLKQIDDVVPTIFTDPQLGLKACLSDQPDLILVDYMMPDLNGLEFIEKVREDLESAEVPILMVTAMEDKEVLHQAFEKGANDFLSKPVEPVELNARVRNMLNLRTRTLQLHRLASVDSMTETLIRRRFFELADADFTRSKRYNNPLSVLMLDIDHFKLVNDSFGHAVGDEVLKKISAICKDALRDVDFIGRIGGEEFAACLPETKIDGASLVAERTRKSIENAIIQTHGEKIQVTVSIGLAQLTSSDADFSSLLNRADLALYAAKESGRNKVVIAKSA